MMVLNSLPEEIGSALDAAGAVPDPPPDGAIDVMGTALALGRFQMPDCALDPYFRHLDELAADVDVYYRAEPEPFGVEPAVKALSTVLSEVHGYTGDQETYDDVQNANLIRVIDRRKGLPVALGLIYMHVARAQGWRLVGLNFPGHFLVRLDLEGERAILDPFAGGIVLSPGDVKQRFIDAGGRASVFDRHVYRQVSDRDVLLRLQNNIKSRYLRDDQPDRALEILETMSRIAPGRAGLWREAGLLQADLNRFGGAIAALERYLALTADRMDRRADRRKMEKLVSELRTRLC